MQNPAGESFLSRFGFFEVISMRLDKYLKVSRLVKRRTVANELCDAKHVEVNGKVARASYEVKVGDVIAIQMGANLMKAEVLDIREHTTKEAAASMYKLL